MADKKSIFSLDEFKGYAARWLYRKSVLEKREKYYTGDIYKTLIDDLPLWLAPKVTEVTRPLFLPLASSVDVDAGIIPAGWDFPQDEPKAEAWKKARDMIFDWSTWNTDGVLYVHYGAQFGLTGLRVADQDSAFQIQPISPLYFMLVGVSQFDDSPETAFLVETKTDEDGEDYEYAEVATAESVRIYRDAVLQDERPNQYGFVPFYEIRHMETGKPLSEPTFQKAVAMLDEANKMGTKLSKAIDHNVEPQVVITGAEPTDLERGGKTVWYILNPEGKAQIITGNVDIPGTIEFIREIKQGVEDALPERVFNKLVMKADAVATETTELMLTELRLKIERCRPNYDAGLVMALRAVGRMAAEKGMSELAVLDDETLRLDDDRPVLPQNPLDQKLKFWRGLAEITDDPIPLDAVAEDLGMSRERMIELSLIGDRIPLTEQ